MQADGLKQLIAPEPSVYCQTRERFEKEIWTKIPKFFPATPERRAQFKKLFTFETFRRVADVPGRPLEIGSDYSTARYRNGNRERPIPSGDDSRAVWKLFEQGCTVQLVQPQRFCPGIRDLCVLLESYFRCTVGCNAYLTPKATQGLAPHHDDVELFICQTEGSKSWKIYAPLNGFAFPNAPSGDLGSDVIGEPLMEATLGPGDVLYLPKGMIHQARAQEEDSVHLTFSTYHRQTWGDFLDTFLQETNLALAEPVCLPVSLREALPMGLLRGKEEKCERLQSVAQSLGKRLRDLADWIEQKPEGLKRARDMMAYDFVTARMAPSDEALPFQERGPELGDRIQVTGEGLSYLLPVMSADGSVNKELIQVVTCLANDPQTHMMTKSSRLLSEASESGVQNGDVQTEDEEKGAIVFEASKKTALQQIYDSSNTGLCIRDLLLDSDSEKLQLSRKLWEHGIVHIMDANAKR